MKVKELIELLKNEDQELEVWLSNDSEGNGYSKLSQYKPDTAYIENSINVYTSEIVTGEDIEQYSKLMSIKNPNKNELLDDYKKVLVLFPI